MEQLDSSFKDPLLEAAKDLGSFMEHWGFKSIHGRVWLLIYISEAPISTPQIIKKLGVSKALVSVAIKELIAKDSIRVFDKTLYGAQTYIATENVASTIRRIFLERELNLISRIGENLNSLKTITSDEIKKENISIKKLDELIEFNTLSQKILSHSMSQSHNSLSDCIGAFKKINLFLK